MANNRLALLMPKMVHTRGMGSSGLVGLAFVQLRAVAGSTPAPRALHAGRVLPRQAELFIGHEADLKVLPASLPGDVDDLHHLAVIDAALCREKHDLVGLPFVDPRKPGPELIDGDLFLVDEDFDLRAPLDDRKDDLVLG